MGGEEFVCILPEVTIEMAHIVSERLRHAIADKPFVCNTASGLLSITTSLGGAIIMGDGDHSVHSILVTCG